MAHIDTITGLDRKHRRHFKKVFNKLNDEFFIRESLLEALQVAPCIIEGPCNSWVFVGVHSEKPDSISLSKLLKFNESMLTLGLKPIQYLAVVDNMIVEEEITFQIDGSLQVNSSFSDYVQIIENKTFIERGEKLIHAALTEFTIDSHSRIKRTFFPESVIPAQCSTRRGKASVDNTAKLLPFFLDYDQELATRLDMVESVDSEEEDQEDISVRLINGVAGSGKTLILINRAALYCKKYPEKKVLLAIHNKPVTEDIKYRFETWLKGKPDNLEIATFHSFALKQYRKSYQRVTPVFGDAHMKEEKKTVLSDKNEAYTQLSLTDEQIWSELEYINDYLIKDKEEYLEFDRQGRGFALQKSQREHIWQLYIDFSAQLSSVKKYLPSLYIKEVALSDKPLEQFDHILLDEAQFFAPSWLQLIKRSLTPGGQLFICADPNQGFLKSRLSWKSVGLNVRGRTKRLNHSYRTTYEIMVAANALLDDLEGNPEDYVKPDYEKMARGHKPQIIYSRNAQDEKKRFLNELAVLVQSGTVALHQIMVLCSPEYNPWALKQDIEKRIGSNKVINYNNSKELADNVGSKIRLLNINSCTGMESGTVFVLGCGQIINQPKNLELSDSEREEVLQESMRKLYVAMTRAGQKLVVFSTEEFPVSVEKHIEITGKVAQV
ncbi:UvrD-helicase domain-containing protein [Vibrio genomosp. F10]|uniref:DNA 3'-5' helicase n=1 Tax=Vibrio genomosp. F10 str. ZF-129 TaxID=1187848 RepID=A0A1E5BFQ4_9VIBR|nr:UvrD-helicase domain-containing protein [Vibrio genomosp. F10]OEE34644.1 DNA helicase [Vibrio genomosp. F10 str. ZF-129]OEF05130.1 DNA helicase [Vibrio genomosp. F10 str. 9ZB36]